MPFLFQIRPASGALGFEMACEGIFENAVHHRHLMDAIVQAVQLGRSVGGDIQIFDAGGRVVDVLPLPMNNPQSADQTRDRRKFAAM